MKISEWAIHHPVTIQVFMLVLGALGWMSYQNLPREAEPDIQIPFVMVTTPYFGVAPSDIESLITDPMEEELEQLKDVREIRSTSAEGASIVSIEFEPSVDIDDALQKVRERVDAAGPELPVDAELPIITEIAFSEFPVIIVNISGDVGIASLETVAEELQDRIERIPGILEVAIIGALEREISVEADPSLLEYYGVTLLEMIGTVQAANLNLPGGSVDVGDFTYLVRVPGEFASAVEIEDLVIREENGYPIRVRDVATVADGYEDVATYSRRGGVPSISLSVSRRAGENIIEITDEVKRLTADMDEELGGAVEFAIMGDKSKDILKQLLELENNILTGLLLVVVVLLFFMGGLRNALFVALAIPGSMFICFAVLAALGVTLNIVVLFSLVLALGMLVDNAIVTVENIFRHGQMGKTRKQAAIDGVGEVAWPIISSTATTVFAFVPLMFWPGIMGEFMFYLPFTVVICLLASLFVALVINPALCALYMPLPKPVDGVTETRDLDDLEAIPDNIIYSTYGFLLRQAVRWPVVVLALAGVMFVGTFALFSQFAGGVEFFPQVTPEQAYVNITLPDGSNVEASDRVVRMVERILEQEENIEQYVADVGAGNGDQMDFGAGGTAPHRSRITIDFFPREEQAESAYATIARIREALDTIPGAEYEVVKAENGPPTGLPISIEIVGREYAELGRIAQDMRDLIRDVPGVVDMKDDFEAGRPEIAVVVDRAAASEVGVSTQDIANTVRAAINGMEASTLRDGEDEVDIIVRLAESSRDTLEDIASLTVSNSDGIQIPLTEVAEVRLQPGFGSIRHVDGDRVVTLTADVADGHQDAVALAQVQEMLASDFRMPPGYTLDFTGQNAEQQESQEFLGRALFMGLCIIALILITQFNSITQPLIILGSVVLSLLGVLWNLMFRGAPFHIIMTGLGIISLAGVVVNNAIVLIDYANQLRDRGIPVVDALYQAGMVRFRPVMLTALTTALSLMPTVLGYSLDLKNMTIAKGGSSVEMWGPMANAVVTGLIVATFLTLLAVPAMYRFFDMVREAFSAAVGFLLGLIGRGPKAKPGEDVTPGPDNAWDPNTSAALQSQRAADADSAQPTDGDDGSDSDAADEGRPARTQPLMQTEPPTKTAPLGKAPTTRPMSAPRTPEFDDVVTAEVPTTGEPTRDPEDDDA